jgi:hypothetical protein
MPAAMFDWLTVSRNLASNTAARTGGGGRQLASKYRCCLTIGVFLRYCEIMKNITVSLDEETYRRARIKAAERDTSVSALVKGFLVALASEEPSVRGLERDERDLRARIRTFTAGNRLSRDDAHERDR